MIYACLNCLAEEMNIFFKSKLKIDDDRAIISGIVNQNGSIAVQGENKVLITLINIIRDTNLKREGLTGAGLNINTAKPICIQLHLMISCYFSDTNYVEALRFLSFAIGFLQEKNVFDHTNTPGMDKDLEKLIFEMESVEPDKLSNIWSVLGAKYMPSVLYKVRMIVYNANKVSEYRPVVTGIAENNPQVV
ncbi:hypothetical protein HDF26_001689 [Pedobacter cryoconitis]|uniref:Pvc16 N-terminal domain-containing protein n=1 Tax=Pedobacter cryoconitis TaxID=188932 RepID=A0A7W9DZA7_9SPHI|nr:DUF4255 domain-containing protein [Pedobacter cryoconitis]MBB5636863.1 hypothetical protein [Pedobacter cryoconitis]MBB6271262.1 hypothetical protein [Pedobacter cryoconitis]